MEVILGAAAVAMHLLHPNLTAIGLIIQGCMKHLIILLEEDMNLPEHTGMYAWLLTALLKYGRNWWAYKPYLHFLKIEISILKLPF